MKTLIGIAIPTFNRANRLEKSLGDLLNQIIKSEKKQFLSVMVSDNGSTDTSADVIKKYSEIFKKNNILFSSHSFSENRGFDANVLACYEDHGSDYVWFLSDDDNVIDGAINSIIEDIQKFSPNVLYYNFDQYPYGLESPYIKATTLYEYIDEKNIQSISKIIDWPKLTSLVIRKMELSEKVKAVESGFMHVALAIQTGLDHGRVLHSAKCIARPDDDFKDHIDFPPYIGNNLYKMVSLVLHLNNKTEIYDHLEIKTTDPLTSSMNTLGSYYRGRFVLTPELKSELYSTVRYELRNLKIAKVKMAELVLSTVKLFISYTYNMWCVVMTGKSATKLRTKKKSI